jgi:hypothetical protein
MKIRKSTYLVACVLLLSLFLISCGKQVYTTNGESIYRTGKNLQGKKMLDRSGSSIPFFNSCQGCHGPSGDRMDKTHISYKALSDPEFYPVPYNDSAIFRFLDHDLKSNGQAAKIGVRWKMSDRDKKDLVAFLKSL